MKKMRGMRALAICAMIALSSVAFAQWNLTWYVDPTIGLPGLVTDSTNAPMPTGMTVYLLSAGLDGISNGLDPLGVIQGDDSVVSLFGGGYASATIGSIDFPFDQQDAGEFYTTSTLLDSYLSTTLYAYAFDGPVSYNGAVFLGNGLTWYGASAVFGAGGGPAQTWNPAGWQTNQGPITLLPEPTTLALLGAGLAGIAAYRKKRLARA